MAELMRIRVQWANWSGGPGISTFYVTGTDPTAALTALNTWYGNLTTYIPAGIVTTVPGSGDIIDAATGTLTGQWQHGNDTTHTCTGSGAYSAASGALVRWHTSTIHNGRRLQGHTFLVPVTSAQYDSSGHLSAAAMTTFGGSAGQVISDAQNTLAVWGRPRKDRTTGATLGPGLSGQITTASASQKVAVLRSRRD